ncbi:threonine/serine exporter family protein [Endozoicomonas euniceicola]|uniref:Threonine/serine exporter family protein n=1 Tax=Endozoicomonas euniceicola TaxID=1234143 RepID=A0ABY6GXN3_9GAMM|nr:threonine/serine exporter family protein [Endozoicomonas euniceicola]UYM17553.1 threonine/serine exporter family protein [Endozoicomonas euniceicola]
MEPSIQSPDNIQRRCSKLLLDIAVLLMSSGAHTERVNRNIQRISESLGYHADLLFSLSGITLTISANQKPGPHYTAFRQIKSYGVHMGVVSAISRLSWATHEGRMDLSAVQKEVERIKKLPHYPKAALVIMVMLAGMAFCRVAGGETYPVILAGLATGSGFLTRHSLLSRGYNVVLSIACASFVASGVSGMGIICSLGQFPEIAVATSVLFLIPGVPMINSVIDLMHGHTVIGHARGVQGAVISFAIAIGIILSSATLGVLA